MFAWNGKVPKTFQTNTNTRLCDICSNKSVMPYQSDGAVLGRKKGRKKRRRK
jgi:hypothetical protein